MNHQYARYFRYEQLPPRLQQVSKPFCELAQWVIRTLPDNRMSAWALEGLIEVKDRAVRSVLDDPGSISAVPMPPAVPLDAPDCRAVRAVLAEWFSVEITAVTGKRTMEHVQALRGETCALIDYLDGIARRRGVQTVRPSDAGGVGG